MVESRCGILCSKCKYKESMNCPTCIVVKKPFWGESCPLKSCAEEKGISHCGLCNDFPGKILTEMAYAKEEGDKGRRIETCKKWAMEG